MTLEYYLSYGQKKERKEQEEHVAVIESAL